MQLLSQHPPTLGFRRKPSHSGAIQTSHHLSCPRFQDTASSYSQGCLASTSRPTAVSPAAAASGTEVADLKQQLRQSLEGLDRGIFGVQAAKRQEIANIISSLEDHNPNQHPTQHLALVAGSWDLLYTTITISGVKKTKLGLREFVRLGAFQQIIDTQQKQALNIVHFRVAGFGLFNGNLSIKASYEVESDSRVSIKFLESQLVPDQLRQLFEKNYDLLLSIFNPEGWLDITYVDNELRVGRDDKGNLFVLERTRGAQAADSS